LQSKAEELAEAHWNYISALLSAHQHQPELIEIIGFHYRSALTHGFGHGVEWAEQQKESV